MVGKHGRFGHAIEQDKLVMLVEMYTFQLILNQTDRYYFDEF